MKKCLALLCLLLLSIPNICMAKEDVYHRNGVKVGDISIPQQVKLVGLGEQTHGNSRLQTLRWDIFQGLIPKGYSNVMLEAYYEDGKLVNEFILGKTKYSAAEVAKKMHFFLYRTQEMANFFQQLKNYNDAHKEKIHFYGIDMQSYDGPKKDLLMLLKKVNYPSVNILEQGLKSENKNVSVEEKLKMLAQVSAKVKQSRKQYEEVVGKEDYVTLCYLCQILSQNLNFSHMVQKNQMNFRDQSMAQNVTLLMNELPGKYFLCAHNGHIGNATKVYRTMGYHLKQSLKQSYYSIGTAVYQNQFMARPVKLFGKGKSNALNVFSLTNDSELMKGFYHSGLKERFYDFATLNKEGRELFNRPYDIPVIGASFNAWLKSSYMDSFCLSDYFDGVILLEKDTSYHIITTIKRGSSVEKILSFTKKKSHSILEYINFFLLKRQR